MSVIVAKLLAKGGHGAVQELLGRSSRIADHRANLGGRQARSEPERNRVALHFRERLERPTDRSSPFVGEEPRLWR